MSKNISLSFSGRTRAFDFDPSIRESSRRPKMQWCQPLRFLNDLNRPIIALVSFPGSGNTWLRYLIQQATGNLRKINQFFTTLYNSLLFPNK